MFLFQIIMLLQSMGLKAQKYDYHWVLGSGDTGIHAAAFVNWNDSFSLAPLFSSFLVSGMTSITSSYDGSDVLFYSDGCRIISPDGELFPNGDTLGPGWGYDDSECPFNFGPGFRQSSIILPFGDSLFYLIYISRDRKSLFPSDPNKYIYGDKLLFAKIRNDNGIITLVKKNQIIIEDTICPSDLTAIHKEGSPGYWLTCVREFTDKILVFSVDSDSIFLHDIAAIAKKTTYNGAGSGQSKFSPDGKNLFYFNMAQDIQKFDFDRINGQLTKPVFITFYDSTLFGGMSISPNSRFLYINTTNKLYQLDLDAQDISESILLIDTFKHNDAPYPGYFYSQELGPDCRIYINAASSYKNLHIIHHPDLLGKDCGFELNGLKLPFYNQGTLTHFPYFRIDSDLPLCDSTLKLPTLSVVSIPTSIELACWSNPVTDQLNINLLEDYLPFKRIQISDISGHTYHVGIERGQGLEWSIDVHSLPPGMYLGSIPVDQGRHYYWFRFLKI